MSESPFWGNIGELGKLSEPATALVNRLADGIGAIFAPHQIVQLAKANAASAKILAEGDVEVSDIQRRAAERWFTEETMKQQNLERIVQKAMIALSAAARPENIEQDWLVNFLDKARLISDAEMQSLWAAILAGEADSPGKFSKRTLSVLTTLSKWEASTFSQLCGFVWTINGEERPVIISPKRFTYGIDIRICRILEAAGLVRVTDFKFANSTVSTSTGGPVIAEYSDRVYSIVGPGSKPPSLNFGSIDFTPVGVELRKIATYSYKPAYESFVVEKWRENGNQIDLT